MNIGFYRLLAGMAASGDLPLQMPGTGNVKSTDNSKSRATLAAVASLPSRRAGVLKRSIFSLTAQCCCCDCWTFDPAIVASPSTTAVYSRGERIMSALHVHNALLSDLSGESCYASAAFLVSRAELPSGSLRVVVRRAAAHLSGQVAQSQQIAQLETARRRVAGGSACRCQAIDHCLAHQHGRGPVFMPRGAAADSAATLCSGPERALATQPRPVGVSTARSIELGNSQPATARWKRAGAERR